MLSCLRIVGAGSFLYHHLCALAVWGGAICAWLYTVTWFPFGFSGPDNTGMIQGRLASPSTLTREWVTVASRWAGFWGPASPFARLAGTLQAPPPLAPLRAAAQR